MLKPSIQWVRNGSLTVKNASDDDAGEEQKLHRSGQVRVISGRDGTEVRWATCSPSFSSLFFVTEWLNDLPSPFMLRYFLSGWFEERLPDADHARARMKEIMYRSDVHLARTVFIKEADPGVTEPAPLLKRVIESGDWSEDHSVDCALDTRMDQFRVVRVGSKSTIARLWGDGPVSYPCQSGGCYDRVVSNAYREVMRNRRMRYDHVYAAMRVPDGSTVWIPYQRVILPVSRGASSSTVRVYSAIADVNIKII